MNVFTVFLSALIYISVNAAVPPEVCFEEFNWADCGKPPTPVVYYWKPGSRCEVALWRGCLPNMNMFDNEYDCVSTCVFTARASPEDYHQQNEIDADFDSPTIIPEVDSTTIGGDGVNSTVTGGGSSNTVTDYVGSTTSAEGSTEAGSAPTTVA